GEGVDLLLLDLQGDQLIALPGLDVEDALADGSDGADRQAVNRREVKRGARHEGFSSVSAPVEFTASTIGPNGLYAIAVTEQGETTIRWNRSSGVPTASATAALIGSAWLTATTVSPGCRSRNLAMVPTMRPCISGNDSPPGNRKPLGYRCTVIHSGFFINVLSSAPVHSPKSHSSRPRSATTLWPSFLAMGA